MNDRTLQLGNYTIADQNGSAQQQSMLGVYGSWPYQFGCQVVQARDLLDFELNITQIREGEPLLNYGQKLRLLIADPIKGMHLREAIDLLKTALKHAYGNHA